jgi:hypothetical protein
MHTFSYNNAVKFRDDFKYLQGKSYFIVDPNGVNDKMDLILAIIVIPSSLSEKHIFINMYTDSMEKDGINNEDSIDKTLAGYHVSVLFRSETFTLASDIELTKLLLMTDISFDIAKYQ